MTLRNATPLKFSPAGLSDALDEGDAFPGAMASLQNLIPDPTTKNVWVCRPAAPTETQFGSFTTPGFISLLAQVGSRCFGMIASGRNAGKDEPFCYDLSTNAFVTVGGVASNNVPTSPATTGDWTPPTASLIGTKLIVTHPGFNGVGQATATGTITFSVNPSNNDTIKLNGTIVTFVTGTPSGNQVQIAGTLALTLTALQTFLAASSDVNISQASYVVSSTVLTVTYLNPGTVGNAFTLAASAATVSGATLTGGAGNFFGWFDISNSSSIVWTGGNTAKNPLPVPPTWVAQFNERAWFGCNPLNGQQPSTPFSDSLNPTFITNASQALTYDDNQPLTCAIGLPLSNQLGGVIQALIVFKGVANIYQVTGDQATSNLQRNTLNVATGTLCPSSLCATPLGVAFMSPDGLRFIDFNANVSAQVGVDGQGVNNPFINPLHPSRISAASNATVLRISVQNSVAPGTPFQDYWYDLARKKWSGPHTLPASVQVVYNNQFVMAAQGVNAALFLMATAPNYSSGVVENGATMQWAWQTVMLIDNEQMAMSEIAEMNIKTTKVSGVSSFTVTAQNENGAPYQTTTFQFSLVATIWGSFIWGSALWGGGQAALYPNPINFKDIVVYARLAISMTGACAAGFKIGDLMIRRRTLGYTPP